MTEDNPYTLVNNIHDLCCELDGDLSAEFYCNPMTDCREDLSKIKQNIEKIENWIEKREIINKKKN